MSESTVKMNMQQLIELVVSQGKMIEELQAKIQPVRNEAQREMTDDDARRIMTGDLKDMKHKEAAAKLGLSYGQVYSCRGEYTFKHIHKELKGTEGYKNLWVK